MDNEKKKEWVKQPINMWGGGGNFILSGDDAHSFAISFQPRKLPRLWQADTNAGETAICDYRGDSPEYYILNGDFRKEYEALVNKGIEACLDFYRSKKDEFNSSWSSTDLNSQQLR